MLYADVMLQLYADVMLQDIFSVKLLSLLLWGSPSFKLLEQEQKGVCALPECSSNGLLLNSQCNFYFPRKPDMQS